MAIKNREEFEKYPPAKFDGEFVWDYLKPAFKGTKIEPTDIDGMVEKNGKVLLFETKGQDKDLEEGQRIAYEALILIGRGDIHLIIIYGKTAKDTKGMEEWYYQAGIVKKTDRIACNSKEVLKRVTAWFGYAKRRKGGKLNEPN